MVDMEIPLDQEMGAGVQRIMCSMFQLPTMSVITVYCKYLLAMILKSEDFLGCGEAEVPSNPSLTGARGPVLYSPYSHTQALASVSEAETPCKWQSWKNCPLLLGDPSVPNLLWMPLCPGGI